MLETAPTLGGFRGLRGDLLVAVKRRQPVTAQELGTQFDLTANGVRRHLKALEDEGLVTCDREVRGVGAPVLVYRLTSTAETLFPREYGPALTLALEALREAKGSEAVTELLARPWDALARDAAPLLEGMPLEERMQVLSELLSARGYMASAGPATDGGPSTALRAHNCAMRDVAERVPEVCEAEARFITRVLGAPVERTQRVLDGGNCCTYCVSAAGASADGTTSSGRGPLHREQA
ncbi:MAG: helix-turn-helix domain-containing protein [Gemmatimonadaceae bacterium]|nr:helix-turn-helix domain-containing protein [Gemmatimonadaceae bacterium]